MKHLSNAPIVEAVIEFGIVPPAGVTVETLDSMRRRIEASYGPMDDLYSLTGQFTFDSKTGTTTSDVEERSHVGFRTATPKSERLVTLTTSSLAFHKLKPYSSWDEVLPEAWTLWEMYREQLRPEGVRRISARYVNHLDLPAPERLRDYLTKIPSVDEKHLVRGYAKLLQIRDRDSDLLANLVEQLSINKKSDGLRVNITIDNDVYAEGHLEPSDDKGLRERLELIHGLKNKLFREALTEKAIAFYEGGAQK